MIPLLLLFTAQTTGAVTPPLLPDYAHAERVDRAEARATAFHRRMDADGDGYVTQAEIARYAAGLAKGATIPGTDAAHPLPAPSLAFFRAADADHDGRISLAEAVAAARRDFDRQDGDHDGVVTPAERIAFITKIMKDGRTPAGVPILPPGPRAGAMPAAPSSTPRPATCATADIVGTAPADLLQSLDDFRASLSAPDRARLDRALPRAADGGVGSCEAVTGSRASCEAAAYLPALRRTGLMPRFLTTICAGPAAIGTGGPTDRPAPTSAPASAPHRPSTSRPS